MMSLLCYKSFRMAFQDSRNQAVLLKLIQEVKAFNLLYLVEHMKGINVYVSIVIYAGTNLTSIDCMSLFLTDAAYRFQRSRT